jgi:hypothetical protein
LKCGCVKINSSVSFEGLFDDDYAIICFFLFFSNVQPLGAVDYLHLSHIFHTVIIRDVPALNMRMKSQARRFITLIDSLYDNRVSLNSSICQKSPSHITLIRLCSVEDALVIVF